MKEWGGRRHVDLKLFRTASAAGLQCACLPTYLPGGKPEQTRSWSIAVNADKERHTNSSCTRVLVSPATRSVARQEELSVGD